MNYFRTIIVQNPFDDPSNNVKYLHDTSSQHNLTVVQSPHQTSDDLSLSTTSRNIIPHSVRFNQELLNNFNINIPISRQTELPSSPNSTTSLIPLPSPLTNNLGVNIHHMNQASITPTMIGTYPTHQSSSHNNYDNHHPGLTGIYVNNPRPIIGKVNQHNGTSSPIVLRYPPMIQPQQYGHQMMKPRMQPPNSYGTIMPQQSPIIYDPNILYRTNGQPSHHLPPDDNILKSLLQINPQVVSLEKIYIMIVTIFAITQERKKAAVFTTINFSIIQTCMSELSKRYSGGAPSSMQKENRFTICD